MPRRAVDEMTVSALNKRVREIEEGRVRPRRIRVGGVGGLVLNVRMRSYVSGEEISASWVLRRTLDGRRRDFALGPWPEVTLSQARERARGYMDKLWQGIDPAIKPRQTQEHSAPSFRDAAHDFFVRNVRGKINARDESKWFNDLETFVFPLVGDLAVNQIETSHIVAITERPHIRYGGHLPKPLWDAVPERAKRCIKKVELILSAETVQGRRSGSNPAIWKDHLSRLLPEPKKVKTKGNQPALPYSQLPAFMVALRKRERSPSAQALEFLILTAARSGEVRGASWSEIDLEGELWVIPASRMKGNRDHRVPLSVPALQILMAAPRFASTQLIWPGQSLAKPMSDATLAALTKKMHSKELSSGSAGWLDPRSNRTATPHGFRSTFRDWAAEQTSYPSEMAELALAHTVGSAVERAYRRTDMVEKRRAIMEDWAEFSLKNA